MLRSYPPYVPAQGAFPTPSGTLFRVWSTRARRVRVVVYEQGQVEAFPLTALGEGNFGALIESVGPGARYRFELDGQVLPDPCARCLPDDLQGAAMVWAPPTADRPPAPELAPAELVISEVHIGTFTPEGTFRAAQARLSLLRDAGITAVQLLPLAAFPGPRSWGDDPVFPFAPSPCHGAPADLMALVDEAHRLGMVALLDLVLDHVGPRGRYLNAYSPEYFSPGSVGAEPGPPRMAPLNLASPQVRRLALDCADHWLRSYRFDGLRLGVPHGPPGDAWQALRSGVAGQLQRLSDELGTSHFLFSEQATEASPPCGAGGTDSWLKTAPQRLQAALAWDGPGPRADWPEVAELAGCLRQLRPGGDEEVHRAVWRLWSRPQARRSPGQPPPGFAGPAAFRAASALLLFLPTTPLLFQGQEWMAGPTSRADVAGGAGESAAGPGGPGSHESAGWRAGVLEWSQREHAEHARALALHRRLLELRRRDPVLRVSDRGELSAGHLGPLLWVVRTLEQQSRVLLVNLSPEAVALPADGGARPELLLDTGGGPAEMLPGHSARLLGTGAPWPAWPAAPADPPAPAPVGG